MTTSIRQTAKMFFEILDEEYETAPANDALTEYFMKFRDRTEAEHKLLWLFGHNYLTEPSVQEYIAQVTASDKYIIPCGPMALFLYEWIDLLTGHQTENWQQIEGLYPDIPTLSDEMKQRNQTTYELLPKVQKEHR